MRRGVIGDADLVRRREEKRIRSLEVESRENRIEERIE